MIVNVSVIPLRLGAPKIVKINHLKKPKPNLGMDSFNSQLLTISTSKNKIAIATKYRGLSLRILDTYNFSQSISPSLVSIIFLLNKNAVIMKNNDTALCPKWV